MVIAVTTPPCQIADENLDNNYGVMTVYALFEVKINYYCNNMTIALIKLTLWVHAL